MEAENLNTGIERSGPSTSASTPDARPLPSAPVQADSLAEYEARAVEQRRAS